MELTIEFTHYIGSSCFYGSTSVDVKGTVDLSDDEISVLVNLVRENEGETDVEVLDLENLYPEIYNKLEDACLDAVYDAEYGYWIHQVYEEGEFDIEEALQKCKDNLDFEFQWEASEYSDANGNLDTYALQYAEEEAFKQWLDDQLSTMSEEEQRSFLEEYCGIEIDMSSGPDQCEVIIPREIVEMA